MNNYFDPVHGDMTAVILDPIRQGDLFFTNGPNQYVRRQLPGPGLDADVNMSYQWMSFSPIGPTYVNKRELMFAQPKSGQYQTLGIQSPGNLQPVDQLVTQPLVDGANPQFF